MRKNNLKANLVNFRDDCRVCSNKKIKKVINLGDMPLAGGFIKKSKMPYSPSGKYFYKRYTNGRCDRRFLRYSIKPDNYNE